MLCRRSHAIYWRCTIEQTKCVRKSQNGVIYSPSRDAGIWEVVVDASFIVDMYLNFRTGFLTVDGGDVLVTSRRAIAARRTRST